MNTADADLWNWMKILFGEAPPIFLLEVILRVIVIYLILVISMRLMGKRMSSMISRNEMLAMVSLAAAIGIPIQDPERGLIPAFIFAAVVIGFQYFISIYTRKSARFESLSWVKPEFTHLPGTIKRKDYVSCRSGTKNF